MSLVNPPRLREQGDALARHLNDFGEPLPDSPARRRAVLEQVHGRLSSSAPPRLVLAVACVAALVAGGLWAARARNSAEPATLPMTVVLATPSATLLDGSTSWSFAAQSARAFTSASTGDDAPLVLTGGGVTLALLPKSHLSRGSTLRLERGTLAAQAAAPLVVLVGDTEVRVRGAVAMTVEQGAARVSVFEGVAEVSRAGARDVVASGASWPRGAAAVPGASVLALVRPPLGRVEVQGEGLVSVDGVSLGAAPLSTSLATGRHVFAALGVEQPAVVEAGEVATVTLRRPHEVLDDARAEAVTNPQRALELYAQVRRGANAEVALYERALLQHRLGDDVGALASLDAALDQFPTGVLGSETALTRAEVLVSLGRRDEAIIALSAFLEAHPTSERLSEVHLLRGDLLREADRCADAAPDLAVARRDARWADEASWSMVACADGSRAALEQYLHAFPAGAHAAEARRALGHEKF